MRPALMLLAILTLGLPATARQDPPAADPEGVEFFEKKIRPVLADRCYSCHSAEAKKLKGNLLLDTRDGLLKGGDLGPSVVPGDPEKSLLIKAVRYRDEDLKMPPKGRLPDEVVADFVAWVRRGAPDPRARPASAKSGIDLEKGRTWWAFQAPKAAPLPDVKDVAWVRSPIDRFILATLEAKGLRPAPEADKRTLLRRVTYDLTGLPPSLEEMEAFLADESPRAFETVVERLLASPSYGEKWGRHWLDVVRYTDSVDARGMGSLGDVAEAWRYRDWVVDALNRDLPFDRFVRMQLAGDLLPGGFDPEGVVATGVLAFGAWGNGDADKEKMLTDIVDDQIDLVGRAFLGLTLACARCHDHKFDPVSTEDYYGLAGIFFSSHVIPEPGPKTDGSQILRVPLAPPEQVAARKDLETRIGALEKRLSKESDAAWAAVGKDLVSRTGALLRAASAFRAARPRPALGAFAAERGLPPYALAAWISYLGNGDLGLLGVSRRDVQGKRGLHAWQGGADSPSATVNTTEKELAFLTIKLPPQSLAVHPSPAAGVAAGWRSPVAGKVRVSGRLADADANCGDGIEWTLDHVSAGTSELARGSIPNGGSATVPEREVEVKEGDLLQLVVLPKKEYTCDTTVIDLSISEPAGTGRVWTLAREVVEGAKAGSSANPMGPWCFYDMSKTPRSAAHRPESALARWLAAADPDRVADEVDAALRAPGVEKGPDAPLLKDLTDPNGPFLGIARKDDAALPAETRASLSRLRQDLAELRRTLPPPIPIAVGIAEGGTPKTVWEGFHDARVHIRGRYDRLGALVPRRFPRVLAGDAQAPPAKGSGRRELAAWLAESPLVARVMANRLWQGHFGEGIVRTPNNYGKLGTPPTHPELLDWLTLHFITSGRSMKALHREILRSATYRQSSAGDPATLKADPGNLLFGRASRRRLTAEELRDSLLAASDGLDRTLKGPSVKDLASGRRTLYLTTVRSDRSTYRMLFDAADPGGIVERRIDSTVAPQALFMMNHPFALSQAKALGEKAAARPGDPAAKIRWLYARLYGRAPAERELKLGLAVLSRSRESELAAGTGAGEERVWEAYGQVLLCANEFIYVD